MVSISMTGWQGWIWLCAIGVVSSGEGYSDLVWMGVCGLSLKTHTHFGRKWYPFLGICLIGPFLKISGVHPTSTCLGIFLSKMGPMFRYFLWKRDPSPYDGSHFFLPRNLINELLYILSDIAKEFLKRESGLSLTTVKCYCSSHHFRSHLWQARDIVPPNCTNRAISSCCAFHMWYHKLKCEISSYKSWVGNSPT